jgi:DNA polymerase III epsilon subunit-like protein
VSLDFLDAPEIIVLDTEFTTWDGAHEANWAEPWQHRELVQIAAVKLALPGFEETACFETLVRPKVNPELSDCFVRLTGIGREDVAGRGLDFTEAQADFLDFCGSAPLLCYGRDQEAFAETARVQGAELLFLEPFINAHPLIRDAGVDTAGHTSGTIHRALGLSMDGHVHNALFDARSLAAALRELAAQGRLQRQLCLC